MKEFDRLVETVEKLRGPEGCPWDREQTHQSLKPYLIEESYEVLESIDRQSPELLRDELGDLLLQIVLHAQIAAERDEFTLAQVADSIREKMIRRHPHVFGDTRVKDVKEIWRNWEKIKKSEQKDSAQTKSILDTIPAELPALFRASKVQKKASRVGFDGRDSQGVLEKIKEEVLELKQAENTAQKEKLIEEFGDILFSLVNLSRKMDIDAEDALRLATKKFENRFK